MLSRWRSFRHFVALAVVRQFEIHIQTHHRRIATPSRINNTRIYLGRRERAGLWQPLGTYVPTPLPRPVQLPTVSVHSRGVCNCYAPLFRDAWLQSLFFFFSLLFALFFFSTPPTLSYSVFFFFSVQCWDLLLVICGIPTVWTREHVTCRWSSFGRVHLTNSLDCTFKYC